MSQTGLGASRLRVAAAGRRRMGERHRRARRGATSPSPPSQPPPVRAGAAASRRRSCGAGRRRPSRRSWATTTGCRGRAGVGAPRPGGAASRVAWLRWRPAGGGWDNAVFVDACGRVMGRAVWQRFRNRTRAGAEVLRCFWRIYSNRALRSAWRSVAQSQVSRLDSGRRHDGQRRRAARTSRREAALCGGGKDRWRWTSPPPPTSVRREARASVGQLRARGQQRLHRRPNTRRVKFGIAGGANQRIVAGLDRRVSRAAVRRQRHRRTSAGRRDTRARAT